MAKMNPYDKQHLQNLAKYQKMIDAIFDKAAAEAAAIANAVPKIDPDKPFSFSDYPQTKKKVEKLMNTLKSQIEGTVLNGIDAEWTLANNKNNELANRVFGSNAKKLTKAQERRYYSTNDNARQAFKERQQKGLNLSDRVWKYTDQFKDEIEMGLDVGIRNGVAADKMTKELKQYLRHPNKLFRRVRDERGQLQLSKAAKDFHPGRGVYRSSYMNARRLAGTETNIAYRTSDYTRWQQMDFVVGIEVQLSPNNHTCKGSDGKPHEFHDICDELAGKYPKDFKFTGWHPNCRCHAVSILKTQKEIAEDTKKIMRGEKPDSTSVNEVKDVPPAFKKYLEKNADRIAAAEKKGTVAYFIKDNPKFTDPNWKPPVIEPEPLELPHEDTLLSEEIGIDIKELNPKLKSPKTYVLNDRDSVSVKLEGYANTLRAWNGSSETIKAEINLYKKRGMSDADIYKMLEPRIKRFYEDGMPVVESMQNSISELKTIDTSKLPAAWRNDYNSLIDKINAFDISKKGYKEIYPEIEYALNMARLANNPTAIKIGLENISTKLPNSLIEDYFSQVPALEKNLNMKEFWDCFDRYVPIVHDGKSKGGYFSPLYKFVNLPNNKNYIDMMNASDYGSVRPIYHEFGHAFDNQVGLRSKPELKNAFADFQKLVKPDNADAMEQAIFDRLKQIKDEQKNDPRLKAINDDMSVCRSTKEFVELDKKLKVLKAEFEREYNAADRRLGALSDLLGAALEAKKFVGYYGHSGDYFKDKNKQLAECISHASELYWGGNDEFKKIAPDFHRELYNLIKKYMHKK